MLSAAVAGDNGGNGWASGCKGSKWSHSCMETVGLGTTGLGRRHISIILATVCWTLDAITLWDVWPAAFSCLATLSQTLKTSKFTSWGGCCEVLACTPCCGAWSFLKYMVSAQRHSSWTFTISAFMCLFAQKYLLSSSGASGAVLSNKK